MGVYLLNSLIWKTVGCEQQKQSKKTHLPADKSKSETVSQKATGMLLVAIGRL